MVWCVSRMILTKLKKKTHTHTLIHRKKNVIQYFCITDIYIKIISNQQTTRTICLRLYLQVGKSEQHDVRSGDIV